MKKVLGLDLGTNSIGWAIVEQDIDKKEGRIIDAGSRIIPMDGVEMSNFKKGLPQTKNAKRREKKGVRIGNKRYKARRNKLIFILQKLDMLPEQIKLSEPFQDPFKITKVNILPIDKHTHQLTAKDFLELKANAIHTPVGDKKDFGKILYRYNQLRGYAGGDENEDFQEEIDDVLGIKNENEFPAQVSRIQTFKVLNYTSTDNKKKKKIIYKITVEDNDGKKWEGETTVDGLKEGGLIELKQTIRRNRKKGTITSIEFSIPNKSSWRKKMENLEKALDEHSEKYGRKTYLSEYFLDVLKENKWQKIRDNVILRQRYKEEFDALWETQAKEHLKDIDRRIVEEIANFLFPGKSETQAKLRREGIEKGIKYIIKEQVIYYQRPLKDQSHLIGDCRFEKGEKVIAKSHPLFQEYKIWEQINKLSITKRTEVSISKKGKPKYEYIDRPLSSVTKEFLFNELQNKGELNFNSVFKKIKESEYFIENQDFFNGLSSKSKLIGNTTRITLKKRLGKFWDILKVDEIKNQIHLWEILYNGKGNEYDINSERNMLIKEYLEQNGVKRNEDNFEKIVIAISTIKFKREYSSLSLKAIEKSLPLVRAGKYFDAEKLSKEINTKIIKIVNESFTDPYELSLQNYLDKNDQLVLQEGGFVNAFALMLLYGKHTAKEISENDVFKSFNDLKPLKQNSLRNPLVEQIVNETIMIVKDIWKEYGKPDEIKIEFARELQNSIKERQKIHEANEKARKTNERIKKRLAELNYELSGGNIEKYKLWESQENKSDEFVKRYEATKSEIEKVKLWEEQGHLDPYTGKPIPLSKVFNKGEYDVDHIIPKSRYFDDSFSNKVLSARAVNREKGNRTAMEYFESGSNKCHILTKEHFIDHVSRHFYGKKRKNLLATKIPDNPIERQKKETQYITIKVREELSKIVGSNNIKTSTGGVTHYLRNHWGLTNVFKDLLYERFIEFYRLKAIKQYADLIDENLDNKQYLLKLAKGLLPELIYEKYKKQIDNANIEKEEEFIDFYTKCHIYKDKNNNLIIKGYSKRLDHRHHSVDALIVALTDEKAVKRLNDLNKHLQDWLKENINRFDIDFNDDNDNIFNLFVELDEQKRNRIFSDIEKFRNVEIPWKGFQYDVKRILDKIIVSHKPKDKILIQNKEEKDENGNIIKNKNEKIIKIRGPLHKETIYGLYKDNYEAYRIPITKLAGSQFDTKGNIEKITNSFLKEIIKQHFKDFNFKKSEAFNSEGIMVLNKKLSERTKIKNGKEHKASHPPIYSIKVYRKKPDENYKISLQKLDRGKSFNNKLYVNTRSNYLFAVLEKKGKRIYDLISLFDAVNLIKFEFVACKNKDLFDKNKVLKQYFEIKNEAKLIFTLKQLDMVYLPDENEDVVLDSSSPFYEEYWNDKERVKKIFTVEKFSGNQIYFLLNTTADVIEDKVELGSPNKLEFFKGRKIVEHCIPITLNRLGHFVKKEV